MHELSIASALFEQMQRHCPPGARVRKVNLKIGPMQAVEPDSLRFSWEALCQEAKVPVPELVLDLPGWQLTCPDCQRNWISPELHVACSCGCATPIVAGGSELQMISIEVDDES